MAPSFDLEGLSLSRWLFYVLYVVCLRGPHRRISVSATSEPSLTETLRDATGLSLYVISGRNQHELVLRVFQFVDTVFYNED